MANRLTALRAILDELNVPLQIDSVENRLIVQKAVYLAQTAVPLGYSYGWYLKGPYSPRLTRDYYEYAQSDHLTPDVELKDSVKNSLRPIRNLIQNKPDEASLAGWLELLASLHFLMKNWKYDKDAAAGKIMETKPHLNHIVDSGWTALQH